MSRNTEHSWFLPRDAMHKCGLCCHAVSIRPSVCLSRSWILSKRINIIFEILSPSGIATPFYSFFRTKRGGDIPTGTPLTGASNAGRVGKKLDSGRISGFAAYSSTVLSTVRVANCEKQSRDRRRRVHRGVCRPLFAQDDDEVFVTGSTLYAGEEVNPPRTQHR